MTTLSNAEIEKLADDLLAVDDTGDYRRSVFELSAADIRAMARYIQMASAVIEAARQMERSAVRYQGQVQFSVNRGLLDRVKEALAAHDASNPREE